MTREGKRIPQPVTWQMSGDALEKANGLARLVSSWIQIISLPKPDFPNAGFPTLTSSTKIGLIRSPESDRSGPMIRMILIDRPGAIQLFGQQYPNHAVRQGQA